MDLASLLSTAPKPYTPVNSSYYKRSAPPSPPAEEKVSLPSISSLLERADGQHSAKRQRLSPPLGERHIRVQPYELPPTPPLRPGSGHGHSRASPEIVKDHRSSISSNGSIHIAQPYASPAPSVSSYTSPIDAPQQALYYSRPPTTSTFAPSTPAPAPLPVQQPLISPVTPAWQHHHYFPPLFNNPVPAEPRPLHLPYLPQGFLAPLLTAHPLPLPHRRKAFPLHPRWLWESVLRAQQYEAPRAGLPLWPSCSCAGCLKGSNDGA